MVSSIKTLVFRILLIAVFFQPQSSQDKSSIKVKGIIKNTSHKTQKIG